MKDDRGSRNDHISPLDPGLTHDELVEIAKRAGYLDGEINDGLPHVGSRFYGVPRVTLFEQDTITWAIFFPEYPEYKDYAALDLVFDELNLRLRSAGEARAEIERSVLVERAVAKRMFLSSEKFAGLVHPPEFRPVARPSARAAA